MSYISVCIPTYEMKGLGMKYLQRSFDALASQTFEDFDVVISDHSKTDHIENLCRSYRNILNINYYRNPYKVGFLAANTNNAIKKATGRLIKLLFQDDFLHDKDSLKYIVDAFDLKKDHWLVSACEHSKDGRTFYNPNYPRYNRRIYLGANTIGSPSVLVIKNEDGKILFDEKLHWLVDVDYYKRCHDVFGEPKILNVVTVVIGVGEHQVTNTIATDEVRRREYDYEKAKFVGSKWWRKLIFELTEAPLFLKRLVRKTRPKHPAVHSILI